jgi:hypothetical protein
MPSAEMNDVNEAGQGNPGSTQPRMAAREVESSLSPMDHEFESSLTCMSPPNTQKLHACLQSWPGLSSASCGESNTFLQNMALGCSLLSSTPGGSAFPHKTFDEAPDAWVEEAPRPKRTPQTAELSLKVGNEFHQPPSQSQSSDQFLSNYNRATPSNANTEYRNEFSLETEWNRWIHDDTIEY